MAPNRITATFEVVTPLFLGGADPASTAELRAPSIKGVLRFWWRALAWNRHGGDLEAIRREEARLFGAAGEEGDDATGSTGQASFILRVLPVRGLKVIPKGEVLRRGSPGMGYFGYGLMGAYGENAGRLERPCLLAPFSFSIELISREPLDCTIVDALKMMGLLGGLGSRVRRGYGSLSLISLMGDAEVWEAPTAKSDYIRQVRAVVDLETLNPVEPPYTAFSKLSRVVVVAEEHQPLPLLDNIGKQMQRYRSWGHDGRVNGEDSERNFKNDHDWSKTDASRRTGHPRRVVFGLPHNYSKFLGIDGYNFERQRRASPLAVHIHKLQDGHIGVVSILRAEFLPAGDTLTIRDRRETRCKPEIDWTVLEGFINGKNKKTAQPYFPNRTQILP